MNVAAQPSPLGAWIAAARPPTLWAAVVPVLVGTSLAASDGHLAWMPALAALLGAVLIQLGTNFVNDSADFHRGADGPDRLGPPRAVAMGWLSSRQVTGGAIVVLAAAVAVGGYLSWVAGWPILVLGLLSVVCAVAYTAGPLPLGYLGLGDLFVLLFFGFGAVCGSYFVQAGTLTVPSVCAGAVVGTLATAILVVNNLRDRVGDARADKRTLAVRFGARFARIEYSVLVVAAFSLCAFQGWWWALLALPLAVFTTIRVWQTDGRALNPLLGATARLELLVGVLLALQLGVFG